MKMATMSDKHVHCALLGDGMVGKTCLTLSYTEQNFEDKYTATVFDNYPVPLQVGGQDFLISLFDTAGQSDFEDLRAYTYKESEVLVICFSVIDRDSYDSVFTSWIPEIRKHTKRKRPVILVGTQIDMRTGAEREVSEEEGEAMAKHIGADCYIECSAKRKDGLKEVFEHVVFSALKFRKKKINIIGRFFAR